MTQNSDRPSDPDFFQFEADFVESLRCIPMQVRLKLDTCGVKLKLEHWHRLSAGDRQGLAQMSCDDSAAYAAQVQALVQQVQGSPAATLAIEVNPAWADGEGVPASVQAQAAQAGATITLDQWRSLRPLQRFALIKLSRPSHENRNFYPALVEFGLVTPSDRGPRPLES
jgi:hypothetical protein